MLYIDLDTHTLKKGRTILILNGVPQNGYKIDPSPVTLEYIEQLYEAFKYSLPNGVKYKKNYFMALPEEKLSAEELIIGKNRSAAKEELELTLLTGILNGSLIWPEENTQWFMQPALERDKDFVLLRRWFIKENSAQNNSKETTAVKTNISDKPTEPNNNQHNQTIIATDNTEKNGETKMTNEKENQNTINTNAIICDGQYYPVTPEVMQLIRDYQKLMEEASEAKKNLEQHLTTSKKASAVKTNVSKETIKDSVMDNIEKSIREDGYIPSQHLWRRWIMAQMLRHYLGTTANSKKETFDQYFVTGKPYRYAWTTALRELKALSHMNGEELIKRERFFNLQVIKDMAHDYKDHFWSYFFKLKVQTKKRFEKHKDQAKYQYRQVPWFGQVYTAYEAASYKKKSDKYFTQHQLQEIISTAVNDIDNAANYKSMIRAVTRFIKTCPVNCNIPKPQAWKNAFKGAGAYYTMDNMIKFHECVFYRDSLNRLPMTRDESLKELEKYTNMFDNDNMEYYKLYAIMCDFVKSNNFNFEKRLAELKAAKANN